MGHVYKWLGTDEQIKELWQNREALDKYLARLKELMEEDGDSEMELPEQKGTGDLPMPFACNDH